MKGKLLILFLFLLPYSSMFYSVENNYTTYDEIDSHLVQCDKDIEFDISDKENHTRIHINSDEDFGPSGYNFSGSGTINDPYLIENLYIDTFDLEWSSIFIIDVTKSFTIRNCIIHSINDFAGIYCSSKNEYRNNKITIENNIIFTNGSSQYKIPDGIVVHNIGSLSITNNTIFGKHSYGLYVGGSENVLIYNNSIEGFGSACGLSSINTIEVKNNQFSTIFVDERYIRSGIFGLELLNCKISNNTFIDCKTGFYSYESKYVFVKFNHFYVVDLGVSLNHGCRSIYIYNNWFIGNENTTTNSFALDMMGVNYFYNSSIKRGNYWSNWDTWGRYRIENDSSGYYPESKRNFDKHPLTFDLEPARKYPIWLWVGITIISLIGIMIPIVIITKKKRG